MRKYPRHTVLDRVLKRRSKYMTPQQLAEHMQTHDRTNSWWLRDARGIECSRVCDECEATVRLRYKPEIFDINTYDDAVEEPIDDY